MSLRRVCALVSLVMLALGLLASPAWSASRGSRLRRGVVAAAATAAVFLATACGRHDAHSTHPISTGPQPSAHVAPAAKTTHDHPLPSHRVFVRRDTFHLGRAPMNAVGPFRGETVKEVVGKIKAHTDPWQAVLLGEMSSWEWNANVPFRGTTYRNYWLSVAKQLYDAGYRNNFFMWTERNASHTNWTPISGGKLDMKELASYAYLAPSTFLRGDMTRAEVDERITTLMREFTGDRTMKIPRQRMMMTIDLSDTNSPTLYYYGAVGNLTGFNANLRRGIEKTLDLDMAGVHTMGVATAKKITSSADSTYGVLDGTWDSLSHRDGIVTEGNPSGFEYPKP